jgi:hypothetical protein
MWHHLGHFLAHLLKAIFEWGVEKHTQHRVLSQGSQCINSFEQHMRYLSENTSTPLAVLKPHLATFEPTFKGRTFITVLVNQGPNISIGMFSNVQFPVRCIPPAVCDRIRGLAQPSDEFDLDTSDGSDGSFVIADSRCPTAELTPAVFIHRTQKMMLLLALVDAWMIEQGYVH